MFKDWHLDTNSGKTVYEQIADYFKTLIRDGRLTQGAVLPSQRDMCSIFDVSRPTISKALEVLEHERLIRLEDRKKPIVRVDSLNPDHMPIDWECYTRTAQHVETSEAYKFINYVRSDINITNLFESYFGHDFFPYKPMEQAVNSAKINMETMDHHSNFDIRGILSLRQTICNYLTKENIYSSPSQIVVFDNIQTAYIAIFRAMCNQNINCYLEEESLFLLDRILPSCVNFLPIQTDNYGVIPKDLSSKIYKKRKGMLILDTHYSMPSCASYPLHRKKEILNLSSEYQLPIVECESIKDCWHETKPVPSLKSLDNFQNVIYIFSLTRPFMLAPMAAVVAPEALVSALLNVKLKNRVYTDIFSQMVMEKLLAENIYTDYMNSIRPLLIERRDQVDLLLHNHFDGIAQWEKPAHGVNYRLNFDFSVSEIFNSLRKEGLLLFPSEFFGSRKHFIWFCYTGVSLEKLDYAFSRIVYYIRKSGKVK